MYVHQVPYELCGDLRGEVAAQIVAAQTPPARVPEPRVLKPRVLKPRVPEDGNGERERWREAGHVLAHALGVALVLVLGGEEEAREGGARRGGGLRLG